jgi:hypothetical protein
VITETAEQVSTVVRALKAGATQLNGDTLGCLHMAVAWCDGCDMWRRIVRKAGVGGWVLDIDPILAIQ